MDNILNKVKYVITFFATILKFIGKIPVFLLPPALKGYRTELFNILAVVAVTLEGMDITSMCESLSSLFHLNCALIQEIFAILVACANIDLKGKTVPKE
ncbi:MAG TPA: hypothetical protein PLD32_09265 [Saprospiraceae bacterium]|nr:hypothetical protein [Saprospiraceae bacterium]